MYIPKVINDKVNDWNGNIMDMKEMDYAKLRCTSNQKIVMTILLSKEEAIVVFTIIRVKELIGYIKKEEKEKISMCTAMREFRKGRLII